MNTLQTKLKELGACNEAIEWAKDYDTLQEAWDNCQRGHWMIWLVTKMEWSNEKDLRLMAVAFARQVQHLMKDQRSINALDVAERYANGEANIDELTAARAAAREAAAASDAAWAAWAAWAAGAAGKAAAAWDVARAADVAGAAWGAVAAWADQANTIRKYLPTVTF
jgi:hypothetical protein